MREIILASESPRRIELIKLLGIPYTVIPSEVDEGRLLLSGTPQEQAVNAACAKAEAVAAIHRDSWILGADTIVYIDGEILGKPRDKADARRMLGLLSGKAHEVTTGLCLIRPASTGYGSVYTGYDKTAVWMMDLTKERVDWYIETGEPMDKAGAYGIQGYGASHIPRVEGCYFNVMGLPLYRLARLLEEAGFETETFSDVEGLS